MADVGRKGSTALFQDGTYDIDEFRLNFLFANDPTEYRAAELCGVSWKEWLRLKKESAWFRRHVREWLEELEVKHRSEAIAKVHELAKSDKPAAYQANKWIAERRYAEVSKRGRPSKKELERETKEIAREAAETAEEAERVEAAVISLDSRRKEK